MDLHIDPGGYAKEIAEAHSECGFPITTITEINNMIIPKQQNKRAKFFELSARLIISANLFFIKYYC